MTLATTAYALGGIALQNGKVWNLRLLSPNEGHERRGDNVLLPGLPGMMHAAKVLDQRTLTLAGFVTGELPGKAPSAEVLGANIDTLLKMLQTDGQQTLTRRRGVRNETCTVECTNINVVPRGPYHVDLIADLLMADPLWYATALTTATTPFSSVPTSLAVTNPGTYTADRMTITLACPSSPAALLTDPVVTIGSVWVKYTGVVGSGSTLTINTETFAATIGSTNVASAITHSGAVRWLTAPPGANTVTVSAAGISNTPTLTISFYAPYL